MGWIFSTWRMTFQISYHSYHLYLIAPKNTAGRVKENAEAAEKPRVVYCNRPTQSNNYCTIPSTINLKITHHFHKALFHHLGIACPIFQNSNAKKIPPMSIWSLHGPTLDRSWCSSSPGKHVTGLHLWWRDKELKIVWGPQIKDKIVDGPNRSYMNIFPPPLIYMHPSGSHGHKFLNSGLIATLTITMVISLCLPMPMVGAGWTPDHAVSSKFFSLQT